MGLLRELHDLKYALSFQDFLIVAHHAVCTPATHRGRTGKGSAAKVQPGGRMATGRNEI